MDISKMPIVGGIMRRWSFAKTVNESLRYWRAQQDPKENASSKPSADEIIEIHGSWIAEAFGPSDIDNLFSSLKTMGWDTPDETWGSRDNLTDWIKCGRGTCLGGSWINGGAILPNNAKSGILATTIRRSNLPKGVEVAHLSLSSVTSSLTVVTILFVYDDATAYSINDILRQEYSTKAHYRPSRFRPERVEYINATKQKEQAVAEVVNSIHDKLYAWFRQNLSGHFASLADGALPTIDMITSLHYKNSKDERVARAKRHTDVLLGDTETWKCATDNGLELRLRSSNHRGKNAVLFGNFVDLTENNEIYGGKSRSGLLNKYNIGVIGTMVLWAIHNLLISYEKQLTGLRDKTSFKIKGAGSAISEMNFIRQHYLSVSANVQTVCNDLHALVDRKGPYIFDTLDFDWPQHYSINEAGNGFIEWLRQQTIMRTALLVKLEARVGATVTASGNLTSAIANTRIQQIIFWLTLVVVFCTVLSTLFSYLGAADEINTVFEHSIKGLTGEVDYFRLKLLSGT